VSAKPAKPTLKKVRSLGGIDEYQLNNGLRVLYRRKKSAPVAAVCVTYHVGSRNEARGHTGSTHILEHLLFKDTEKFKKVDGKDMTKVLEFIGALLNATTWFDRTNYFECVPNDKLEQALEIEADRMRHSLFNEHDLMTEMTVVRNEYERGRNDPFELLTEALWAKSFTKHPYRIPTIGSKADIENATAAKLREFYDTFYWPNNSTLMIAGDVPFSQVQKFVLRHFGPIPASPHKIPALKVKEPKQSKPRSVRMQKPMGVSLVEMQYKICAARDKDYPALYALSMVLGGGFSSRMVRALVDTGLAADVTVYALPLHDPGIMALTAHVAEGAAPAGVLKAMRREVARMVKEGVTKEELAHAKERIRSLSATEREGAFNVVRSVSEALAAGDWRLWVTIDQAVEKLKPADVLRAAKKYLQPSSETSGILINK
jgi:zinc protease